MTLKELSLFLPNRPGALVRITRLLAKDRINLAAISVDSTSSRGRVRLMVNNPDRARELLVEDGLKVEEREMLAVRLEDRAGSLLQVLEPLAREKINIQSVAILIAREGARSLVALSVDDLTKARRILTDAGFISRGAEKLVSNADLLAGISTIPSESVGLLL